MMVIEIPTRNEKDLGSMENGNDRNMPSIKVHKTAQRFFQPFVAISKNLFSVLLLEKCWFCLSSPSVEKHMVISVGDNFYLALAKGPLDETNILILSVTHIQSSALLTEDDWKELEKFKDALRKFFKGQFRIFDYSAIVPQMNPIT